jgi:N-acetylglucosamine malate deacetylase 1
MDESNSEGIKDLIIAPHADDEVLGCGGILGKNSFVYYCGIDEGNLPVNPEHRQNLSVDERQEEIKTVADFLGFKWECNLNAKVNYYEEVKFIAIFEELINRMKPERVFIPFPSYNQDHRAVYNAAQIALRPHDKNFFVKKVLVYEQPQSIIWEHNPFKINYFVPIDIERKITANGLHKSQVRGMRSPELLRSIATLRGSQINKEAAEAFHIQRWTD